MFLLQYAWALRVAEGRQEGREFRTEDLLPGIDSWKRWLPEAEAICGHERGESEELRYTLRFLAGKKDEHLRDSRVRDLYFSTELAGFNEFDSFEEWEVMLPQVLHLWRKTFREAVARPLVSRDEGGVALDLATRRPPSQGEGWEIPGELSPGLYSTLSRPSRMPLRLSPFCEWTECKLHRKPELFVFAGLLRKQHGLPALPAFLGPTPTCEPMLSASTVEELRSFEAQATGSGS